MATDVHYGTRRMSERRENDIKKAGKRLRQKHGDMWRRLAFSNAKPSCCKMPNGCSLRDKRTSPKVHDVMRLYRLRCSEANARHQACI
jgi:hypothetical protein